MQSGCAFPECLPDRGRWLAHPGSAGAVCPAAPSRCPAAVSCPANTGPPGGSRRPSGARYPARGQSPCGSRPSNRRRWPDSPLPSNADSRTAIRSGCPFPEAARCGFPRPASAPAAPRCRSWDAPAPASSSCWSICPRRSAPKSRRHTHAARADSNDRRRSARDTLCTSPASGQPIDFPSSSAPFRLMKAV